VDRTIASVVDAFTVTGDNATGWKSIANTLAHGAPDPIAVLRRADDEIEGPERRGACLPAFARWDE
jgi:hypothetical protein